jgi:hypothetical protein
MAVNRDMLRRAWAMGAAPAPGILTIDPDATYINTYGRQKEGSAFSYKGEVQMSPLVGVVGDTGDVLALRARGGNASPRKKLGQLRRRVRGRHPQRGPPALPALDPGRLGGLLQEGRRGGDQALNTLIRGLASRTPTRPPSMPTGQPVKPALLWPARSTSVRASEPYERR